MSINKRSSVRKKLNLYVDVYSFDKHLGHCQTRDINLNGAFIDKCAKELRQGDMLELQLHVCDGEHSPLRLRATVARSTDEGVAVLFDYGAQEYRRLLNLISTYASDGNALKVPGFWYLSDEKGPNGL